MSHWYAVYCKPQQDARAEENLCNQAYEVFRPQVRLRRRHGARFRQVVESMFPRYLFIRLSETSDWAPLSSTRGVVGLVRWGTHAPRVPNVIIDDLRLRAGHDQCIEVKADYYPNARVRITQGPFTGYEALFECRNGEERVSVLLEMMRRTQRLILPERFIEAV